MMRRNVLLAGAGAAALALSGCAVGPAYVSPTPAAPGQTPFLEAGKSPAFTGEQPAGHWWSLFGDPTLDALVEEALAANTDLRVAAANLIGYQVDLFGRVESAIRASRADADAVQAAFDLTRITVAAETTRAYADVCAYNRQLAVAEETLRIQEQTFDLTRRLFEGGRATRLDTGQAGALLEQTRATLPTLKAQRAGALYRLALLTGKPPAEAPQAALLARRPDIRRAERQLAAAAARVNVWASPIASAFRSGR